MKSGFSRFDITPSLGEPLFGYFVERKTEGVLDPLYVSAVALESKGQRSAIIELDLCEFSSMICDNIREQVSISSSLDKDAVFIVCSHTHTGPVVGRNLTGGSCCSKEYYDSLIDKITKCVKCAFDDLKPSRIYISHGNASNISFCRRYRMKDGKVQTNPGVNNANIDYPLGDADSTVELVKIVRESAEDIYIVNYGTHADTVGGNYVSGDWPAFVRETVENALGNVKCVFLTGAQGDVNHINTSPSEADRVGLDYNTFDGVPRGYEHTKHMGRVVGAAVLSICDKAVEASDDEISFSSMKISVPTNKENHRIAEAQKIIELDESGRLSELPYKKMELTTVVAEARRIDLLYNAPDCFEYSLFALKIGGVALVGLPGECFVEIGKRIKEASPFASTIVCCLTNGGDTYFPTSRAYDEGGYEARSSVLKRGADDILVDGMLTLLNKLYK